MAEEVVCQVCGNVIESTLTSCPYCLEKRNPEYFGEAEEQYKVINLERGMPIVRDALKRLKIELDVTRQVGTKVLVLIHGYGSSGEGGAIKKAVRQQLRLWLDNKKINDLLTGEECGKRSGHARNILQRFPFLKDYLHRANPGITIVIF